LNAFAAHQECIQLLQQRFHFMSDQTEICQKLLINKRESFTHYLLIFYCLYKKIHVSVIEKAAEVLIIAGFSNYLIRTILKSSISSV